MQPAAQQGSTFITGHLCSFTSSIVSASSTVFVGGKGAARRGDASRPHTKRFGKKCIPHIAFVAGGSSTVFVDGRPMARVGDRIDGVGRIITGASTVIVG